MTEQIAPRFQFRQPLSSDHDGLAKLYQHPVINAHIGGDQLSDQASELAKRIIKESAEGKAFYGLYTDQETGVVVGLTSLAHAPSATG